MASLKRISLENIFYRDGIFFGGVLQRVKEAEKCWRRMLGRLSVNDTPCYRRQRESKRVMGLDKLRIL